MFQETKNSLMDACLVVAGLPSVWSAFALSSVGARYEFFMMASVAARFLLLAPKPLARPLFSAGPLKSSRLGCVIGGGLCWLPSTTITSSSIAIGAGLPAGQPRTCPANGCKGLPGGSAGSLSAPFFRPYPPIPPLASPYPTGSLTFHRSLGNCFENAGMVTKMCSSS